jgi:hypothetical protein
MDIEVNAMEIAKSKGMDMTKFCSWLLEQREASGSSLKTIDGVVFKSVGICRYFTFYAKYENEPDDKFVVIMLFRD